MEYRLGIDLGAASLVAAVAPVGAPVALLTLGEGGPVALVSRLRDPNLDVADALAALLRFARDRAVAQLGGPPREIVVTVPGSWSEPERVAFDQAVDQADLGPVRRMTQAEAAALGYAALAPVPMGGRIAVFDLGASSCEASVLERRPDGFGVLASAGASHPAGADFDEAVYRLVLGQLGDRGRDLGDADAAAVRRASTTAREQLSATPQADVPVPALGRTVRLGRSELESLVRGGLRDGVGMVTGVLRQAGLQAQDLAAVVAVGGCSRMPIVRAMLAKDFPVPIAVSGHPELDVAIGAAGGLEEVDRASAAAAAPPPAPAPAPPTPAAPPPAPAAPPPAPAAPPPAVPEARAGSRPATPVPPPVAPSGFTPAPPPVAPAPAAYRPPAAYGPPAASVAPGPGQVQAVAPWSVQPGPVPPEPPAAHPAFPPAAPASYSAVPSAAPAYPAFPPAQPAQARPLEQSGPVGPAGPLPPVSTLAGVGQGGGFQPPPVWSGGPASSPAGRGGTPPVAPRRRLLLIIVGAVVLLGAIGGVVFATMVAGRQPVATGSPSATAVSTPVPTTPSSRPSPTSTPLQDLPKGPPLRQSVVVVPMAKGTSTDLTLYLADTERKLKLVRLPAPKGSNTNPLMQPSRDTIIYLHGGTLRVMASDGSGDRPLFNRPAGGCPNILHASWDRADPNLILINCQATTTRRFFLEVDLAGNLVRQLDPGGVWIGDFSLSPDGGTVVYWATDGPKSTRGAVYSLPLAGTAGPTQLTGQWSGGDACPFWSSDGTQLAYSKAAPSESRRDVFLMAADGSGSRTFASTPADDYKALWSPDDSKLLVISNRSSAAGPPGKLYDLWLVRAGDGKVLGQLGLKATHITRAFWSLR